MPCISENNLTSLDAGTRSGGGEQQGTSAERALVATSAQPVAKRRRRRDPTLRMSAQDRAGDTQ